MLTKTHSRPYIPKYAVTEAKKAELDALTLQILDAQQQVDQYQSIVTSLTQKEATFQNLLAIATNNRSHTLSNKNTVDQVVQLFLDLQTNSSIAFDAMALADTKTRTLSKSMNDVMNKLIYSAEVINKLATAVVRKKALNPLVSDELVSLLNQAGTDANNAVALTLVALQTVFTALASNMESEAASSIEYLQSMAVYQLITGTNAEGKKADNYTNSLQYLIHQAYEKAKIQYEEMYNASLVTTQQLNDAQLSLAQAQISLQSLQAGLAAGNAAALA
jgi:hypothetical protein